MSFISVFANVGSVNMFANVEYVTVFANVGDIKGRRVNSGETTLEPTTLKINKEKETATETIEPFATTTGTTENFIENTTEGKEIVLSSTTTPTELKTTPTLQINNCLNCDNWSPWEECTQICGGCGKIKRKRICNKTTSINCQTEEKRLCNQNACPVGTNFLFSNGEFQLNFLPLKIISKKNFFSLLWKGCCFGLFPNKIDSTLTECGPLENNENIFMKILSSLLVSHDGRKNNRNEKMRKGEH
ncbi:unnamed protein product [Meloidogyne enterolobii]|uniref:Uncharacterized protein n=1 Tax=Meloidogyne enterolobii TaxID=390850 RepID=A0ACB1A5T2_MELEN